METIKKLQDLKTEIGKDIAKMINANDAENATFQTDGVIVRITLINGKTLRLLSVIQDKFGISFKAVEVMKDPVIVGLYDVTADSLVEISYFVRKHIHVFDIWLFHCNEFGVFQNRLICENVMEVPTTDKERIDFIRGYFKLDWEKAGSDFADNTYVHYVERGNPDIYLTAHFE